MRVQIALLKNLGKEHGSSQAKFCKVVIGNYLDAPSKKVFDYPKDVERNIDSILNEQKVDRTPFVSVIGGIKSTIEFYEQNSSTFTEVEKLALIACEQIMQQYSRGILRNSVVDALTIELNITLQELLLQKNV